jgi:hypothetical protein
MSLTFEQVLEWRIANARIETVSEVTADDSGLKTPMGTATLTKSTDHDFPVTDTNLLSRSDLGPRTFSIVPPVAGDKIAKLSDHIRHLGNNGNLNTGECRNSFENLNSRRKRARSQFLNIDTITCGARKFGRNTPGIVRGGDTRTRSEASFEQFDKRLRD